MTARQHIKTKRTKKAYPSKVVKAKDLKPNHVSIKMKRINNRFLLAGGMGISAAIFYSLTPLFVFFFADNPLTILYPIFLATVQELMSFALVATTIGFRKWKTTLKPENYWLNFTIIIPFLYFIIVGITLSIINLVNKLRNAQVWLMAFIGLLAGPFSMALLMIAALYLNDGTLGNIILNTAPIYCMILSRIFLKQRINGVATISMILTSLFTFGMLFNYFILQPTINWKSIIGVCLAFVAALLYGFESTISDYFLHNRKIMLTNYEIVNIKSFMSFWIMLLVALPVAALIDHQEWYQSWSIFRTSFQEYGWLALLIYLSGIVMGFGRLIYFKTVHLSTGTYALATQLTMLIWTPVLQILGNLLIPQINTIDLPWYYWLWSGLILCGLILLTFNESLDEAYGQLKAKRVKRKTRKSTHKKVKTKKN